MNNSSLSNALSHIVQEKKDLEKSFFLRLEFSKYIEGKGLHLNCYIDVFAPMNYVGVAVTFGEDSKLFSYHDSCWRSDGIECAVRILDENGFSFCQVLPHPYSFTLDKCVSKYMELVRERDRVGAKGGHLEWCAKMVKEETKNLPDAYLMDDDELRSVDTTKHVR